MKRLYPSYNVYAYIEKILITHFEFISMFAVSIAIKLYKPNDIAESECNYVEYLAHLPRIYASVNRVSIVWDNGMSPIRR